MTSAVVLARSSIAQHSKSFSLASKFLPLSARDASRILYAWCRRVDDAVDQVPRSEQAAALSALEAELATVYSEAQPDDPLAAALQVVVRETNIPRQYPAELLLGMRMDAEWHVYATWDDLLTYCHRVAGVVGLMMCHVLGVRDRQALRHAAHLGIAMQLTNIARDVLEDWERGRLYLPDLALAEYGSGGLLLDLGKPFPLEDAEAIGQVVRRLLTMADEYYASGDEGMRYLAPQTALAVRTARLVYADIGREIAASGYDVLAGRAVVSRGRKLVLAARAAAETLLDLPAHLGHSSDAVGVLPALTPPLSFPHDILPV